MSIDLAGKHGPPIAAPSTAVTAWRPGPQHSSHNYWLYETVAEVRAVNAPNSDVIRINSNGEWKWDATDTSTDDGTESTNAIQITGITTGRYLRNAGSCISLLTPSGAVARATASMPERFGYSASVVVTPEMFGATHATSVLDPTPDQAAIEAAAAYVDGLGGGTVVLSGHYYVKTIDATGLEKVTFECQGATIEQTFSFGYKRPIFDLTGSCDCVLRNATLVGSASTIVPVLMARGSGTGYLSCNRNRIENLTFVGACAACIVMWGCEDCSVVGGILNNQYGAAGSYGCLMLGNTCPVDVESAVALHVGNASTLRNNFIDVKFLVGVSVSNQAPCVTIVGTPEYRFDACGFYSTDNATPVWGAQYIGTDAHSSRGTFNGCLFEISGSSGTHSACDRFDNAGLANSYYQHITVEDCTSTGSYCDWVSSEDSSIITMALTFRNNTGPGALGFGLLTQSIVDTTSLAAGAGAPSVVTVSGSCYGNKFTVMAGCLSIPAAAWLDRSNQIKISSDGGSIFGLHQVERLIVQDLQDHYGSANVLSVWFSGGATFNGNSHATAVTALVGANLTGTDGSAWHASSHNGRAALLQSSGASVGLYDTTLSGALSVCVGVVGSSGGTVDYETMFESTTSPYTTGIAIRDGTTGSFVESGGQQHYVNGVDTAVIPSTGLMIVESNVASNTQAGGAWLGDYRGTRCWLGKALFGRALSIQPTAADIAWEYRLWLKYCSYFSDG